jgi:hypothetical protein
MILEFWSSLKRGAENIGICIGVSLDHDLPNDLHTCIRAKRNDSEVEEENCDLGIELATYERDPTDHGVRKRLRETLKRH